ncbi:SRPBCC family protein [Arthrobacter antibioticus]|uniref:SRPBCC family protein n=1 Tax=Arthrobacter sp. H35-MC1 TaxID=3046203 RepID=UPI0024BA1A9E|nr:SRPBCC family protein [Arthrobacter sp. H35-MC1]MDJ0316055.1 SRPBCC family protein [Arthrobacter sp. H35-MC1]
MVEKLGRTVAARKPLYIEIRIRAPMERVWELSQDPQMHPRWDLRFSRIVPIDEDEQRQVRFGYEFLLPLHTIKGTGTSLGHRHRADGQATSVLKFDTADVLSPIGPGSGYWRYIPTDDGLRFITGYNYEPGLGMAGKALDSRTIRPALGWATALSFDRLRLWAESDLEPRHSRNRWFLDAGARIGGVLVAVGLFRRALAKRSATMAALGAAAVALSCLVKPHWSVPRASRCLRNAPDAKPARAPSTLAGLREPSQSGLDNQQPTEME